VLEAWAVAMPGDPLEYRLEPSVLASPPCVLVRLEPIGTSEVLDAFPQEPVVDAQRNRGPRTGTRAQRWVGRRP
jgi:hypothetical protein